MLEVSGRSVPFAPRTKAGGEFTNKLVEIGDVELAAEGEDWQNSRLKAASTAHSTGDGGRETMVFYFVEGSPVNQGSKRTMLVERLATTATIDQGSERRAQPR